MNTHGRIVVGVDRSEGAAAALRWAASEAIARGATLTALHVARAPFADYPFGSVAVATDLGPWLEAAQATLDATVATVLGTTADTLEIERRVITGSAADVLIHASVEADMVVVGARDEAGIIAKLLGTVSDQVVRHAHCPVVVVPGDAQIGHGTAPIVAAVDGSPHGDDALRWALEAAAARGAKVRAVMIWSLLDQRDEHGASDFHRGYDEDAALAALRAAVGRVTGPDGVDEVELVVACDLAAHGILDAAEEAGAALIVVGARGLGGFKGLLLGSVSSKVLSGSHRPVAVVRTDAVAKG